MSGCYHWVPFAESPVENIQLQQYCTNQLPKRDLQIAVFRERSFYLASGFCRSARENPWSRSWFDEQKTLQVAEGYDSFPAENLLQLLLERSAV